MPKAKPTTPSKEVQDPTTVEYWMDKDEDQRLHEFDYNAAAQFINSIVQATLLTDRSMAVIYAAIDAECTSDATIQLIHEAMPDLDINARVDEEIQQFAVGMGWTAQDMFQRTLFIGTVSKWDEGVRLHHANNAAEDIVNPLIWRSEFGKLYEAILSNGDVARWCANLLKDGNAHWFEGHEETVLKALYESNHTGEPGEYINDVLAQEILKVHGSIWEPVQFDAALETVQRRHSH